MESRRRRRQHCRMNSLSCHKTHASSLTARLLGQCEIAGRPCRQNTTYARSKLQGVFGTIRCTKELNMVFITMLSAFDSLLVLLKATKSTHGARPLSNVRHRAVSRILEVP